MKLVLAFVMNYNGINNEIKYKTVEVRRLTCFFFIPSKMLVSV